MARPVRFLRHLWIFEKEEKAKPLEVRKTFNSFQYL